MNDTRIKEISMVTSTQISVEDETCRLKKNMHIYPFWHSSPSPHLYSPLVSSSLLFSFPLFSCSPLTCCPGLSSPLSPYPILFSIPLFSSPPLLFSPFLFSSHIPSSSPLSSAFPMPSFLYPPLPSRPLSCPVLSSPPL